jgi:3-oxoadipate enol-lactonase
MPKARVGDIELYYQVHGDGFPLLMIMGFGGGHDAWFFQTRAFKKHFKVIVFDNRGIGRTPRSPTPYTTETMAADAVGLLKHLGIGKAHVLGMSLGGKVAQEIAISYPEMVEKLVLVCTIGSDADSATPGMLQALGVNEGDTELHLRSIDFGKAYASIVSLAYNKRLYRMILVPLARYQTRRQELEGQLEQMEASAGHSTYDRLHAIKAPTLVITGTEDRIVNPRASEEIAGKIPGAKLVKLEGGSHSFFMEMRGKFNKEILGFLRDG